MDMRRSPNKSLNFVADCSQPIENIGAGKNRTLVSAWKAPAAVAVSTSIPTNGPRYLPFRAQNEFSIVGTTIPPKLQTQSGRCPEVHRLKQAAADLIDFCQAIPSSLDAEVKRLVALAETAGRSGARAMRSNTGPAHGGLLLQQSR
jgi:hypothetical protein